MRILTKEEYRALCPQPRQSMGGKRINELMAFHSSEARYGELARYSVSTEADRNGYNTALKRLVEQKTILPDTLKIHARRETNAVVIENIRIPEE